MKQYNFKSDLSNSLYVLSIIFVLATGFLVFALGILYPVYFAATRYTTIYSRIVVLLIGVGSLLLLGFYIYKKISMYRSVGYGILHIFVYPFLSVISVACFVFIEAVSIRVITGILGLLLSIIAIVLINVVLFLLLLLLRRTVHPLKMVLFRRRSILE